ncbi:MAG: 4-hydroxyphenylpyruvate dioxygenase [Parcubacteria group bacterium]|nr:4-hydroxyphenylpyruvate dioxygenase [Parcubacteria group bacterium]
MSDQPFPIIGIHHLEVCAGSASQFGYMLERGLGFNACASRGTETGDRHQMARVYTQGNIRFAVKGALSPESKIARQVREHGDFVRDIALQVPDAIEAFNIAKQRGAILIQSPETYGDEHGRVVIAKIGTYGEVAHSLIENIDYTGPFLPGYVPYTRPPVPNMGLKAFDHIVGNVELGQMEFWAKYYARVLGMVDLVRFSDKEILAEYSALMSIVMWNDTGILKFPINEPAANLRLLPDGRAPQDQIRMYLNYNRGAGVQHIALETDDIIATVTELKARGIEFLDTWPQSYYDEVRARFGSSYNVDYDALARLGILADCDEDGYLLQIFSKFMVDRPTIFFEIIERKGSRGFGVRNFKSLFEALEIDQKKKGLL